VPRVTFKYSNQKIYFKKLPYPRLYNLAFKRKRHARHARASVEISTVIFNSARQLNPTFQPSTKNQNLQATPSIKQALHNRCLAIAEERIAALQQIINETQQAANNETKSSSGDKHETGRAMAQLETEKLMAQLSELQNIKQNLTQINPAITGSKVVLGSLVYTSNGNFYIAASIGKVAVEDQSFFAISSASPIGKLLFTKKEKESFSLNGNAYTLLEVI
jgi:transcription elongation GreA/GreB family factor